MQQNIKITLFVWQRCINCIDYWFRNVTVVYFSYHYSVSRRNWRLPGRSAFVTAEIWTQDLPNVGYRYPNHQTAKTFQLNNFGLWDFRFSRQWGRRCWCGLWRRVDWLVFANVSEKHTASIFRAENGDYVCTKRWHLPSSAHDVTT
jgi:hypothetical protein